MSTEYQTKQEYQCSRCEEIFYCEAPDCFGVDPICPKCGSVSVKATSGVVDDLNVLRTRGAGSGGG